MSYDELALRGNNAILNQFAENEAKQFPSSWRRYMDDQEEMEYWAVYPILTEKEKAEKINQQAENIDLKF